MTREEYLKYGIETGLLKFWEYLKLTRPLKLPEGLEEAAVEIADILLAKPKDYAIAAKADYWNGAYEGAIAGAEWQKEKDTRDMFMSDNRHFNKVYELGKKDMKAKMMGNAVGGRYMKADGKVYVESWLLDIDPDSVKAGDEVRLIVIPK